MESFYVFSGILLVFIVIAAAILNYIFRGSYIVSIVNLASATSATVGIACYYVAVKGNLYMLYTTPFVTATIIAMILNIRKQISKPVSALTQDIVTRFSKGDLSFEFDPSLLTRKNEFGEMAVSLDELKSNLALMINKVQNIAEEIDKASNEQRISSEQLSQGASEQAASAEELASSIEEMTANIHQNSQNMDTTSHIYEKVRREINEVHESTDKNSKSVKDIAGKISIINDIAFQTNILALNAAVEAARAGESGKGFAVVASEVRKLAEHSKLSADEINVLAESNVKVSESAGSKLKELMPEINKTSNLVSEVQAATDEQKSGVEQINNAINQLNGLSQQNASSAEELASSSELLSEQSSQLKDVSLEFLL